MSSHIGGYPVSNLGPGRILVGGSFVTAGSGSPTSVRGHGFSVARTAAGRYTVTLDDPVRAFDAILLSEAAETLPGSNVDEFHRLLLDEDVTDTDSFEIRLYILDDMSGSGAPALGDDAGTRISFLCLCRTLDVPDTATAS